MSKAAVLGLLTIFVAGGLLLLAPKLMLTVRKQSAVESKVLSSERDDSFQPDPSWLTEFELTERSGRKFRSADLAGQVHVVDFFFTSCPTACPLQSKKVQELEREFGPQGVRFVSISCDPDRDTPEKLREYADRYQADPQQWLFLTGEFDYIRRVAAEIYSAPLAKMGHVEELILVDKWGKVRDRFKWNDAARFGELRDALKKLLAETEPPVEPQAALQVEEDSLPAEAFPGRRPGLEEHPGLRPGNHRSEDHSDSGVR